MQELARKFAAELSFDFGDVVGEVAAARPTPLSVLAGTRGRQLRLCHRRPRRPVETAENARQAAKPALTDWRGLAPILRSQSGIRG